MYPLITKDLPGPKKSLTKAVANAKQRPANGLESDKLQLVVGFPPIVQRTVSDKLKFVGHSLPPKAANDSFVNLARHAHVIEVVLANLRELPRLVKFENFAAFHGRRLA